MEKMPYVESSIDGAAAPAAITAGVAPTTITSSDWRNRLPVLGAPGVTLRELTKEDATSLHAMLTTEEASRFISPPPTTIAGFEKFIEWTHRQREAGRYFCFGVVPDGMTAAVGLFQVRIPTPAQHLAEWGFAIGSPFWGTGLFMDGAQLVLDFVFGEVGIQRLEARSSVENGRGNGALKKLGAVHEGVLRQAFLRNEWYHDQNLWSIVATNRSRPRASASGPPATPMVH